MRGAACSCASQTIVIRETSARSDSPTVNETMLMLRRRKSEATRVRTPGLSWTKATNVWSIRPRGTKIRLLHFRDERSIRRQGKVIERCNGVERCVIPKQRLYAGSGNACRAKIE